MKKPKRKRHLRPSIKRALEMIASGIITLLVERYGGRFLEWLERFLK